MKIENIKLFDIFIPFINATIKCVFRDINITYFLWILLQHRFSPSDRSSRLTEQ